MRMKIRFPTSPSSFTVTRRMFSAALPVEVWITVPSDSATISTRDCLGSRPPPTRKLAHGWVTTKPGDVSVPVPLSPARS